MQELDDLYPLLEAIVSFMDEGVIIADDNGRVLYQNPAAGAILGNPPSEPIRSLSRAGGLDLQRAGRPGGEFLRFEHQVPRNGATHTIEFHSGLVEVAGGARKLRVIICQDRTPERRWEAVFNRAGSELLSTDSRMLDILTRIDQIAPTGASVLLQGESGVGKTRIARLIHSRSSRARERLVEVNCAAIPEPLIESELFGHVRGAFTGAIHDRPGRFQAADGGTLFLDEVGEIPLHLQAKLLRAIQEQEFEPVGSDRPVKVDARVVSASNRNLRSQVESGAFRADLYYRLAVIPIDIPPLRERPGDLPLLLRHFRDRLVARGYPANVQCVPETLRMLMDYPWPGNVREMENAVEHGIICAVGGEVRPESLPQHIRDYRPSPSPAPLLSPAPPTLSEEDQRQRRELEDALARASHNRAAAARLLGIDRTTLWRRMKRFGGGPGT